MYASEFICVLFAYLNETLQYTVIWGSFTVDFISSQSKTLSFVGENQEPTQSGLPHSVHLSFDKEFRLVQSPSSGYLVDNFWKIT